MFVCWKSRPLTKRSHAGRRLLWAVLAESVRVGGKPRQRTIAYLGSIHDTLIDKPYERALFWREVNKRLDALALEPDARARVVALIAQRVPPQGAESAQAVASALGAAGA